MTDNACAVLLPNTYKAFSSSSVARKITYIRQTIALELERQICDYSVNHFIMGLIGQPALDAAEVLLTLKETYPYVMLEFIADTPTHLDRMETHRDKHDYLVKHADVSIPKNGPYPHDKYLKKYLFNPKHNIYAILNSNRAIIGNCSQLLDTASKIALSKGSEVKFLTFPSLDE